MSQPGFFDLDERYQSLSRCGDPLEVLSREIPWESFRYLVKKALVKPRKSSAGRKAFDPVMISTNVKHKLIRKWAVTAASTHDSQVLMELLDENNSGRGVRADDLSLPLPGDRGEAKKATAARSITRDTGAVH